MNKCVNGVIINDTPIEEVSKDISIDIVDLMRNLKRTCLYCKFSESACDDEDGYHCHCEEHNKNYLVMSGDYCSNWQEKDNENS